MNFQQLRIIRETAQRGFNLTEAALALHTSPSGVSKHILDLEDELGLVLFERRGKRLTGLTAPGKELLVIAERMLVDANNIKRLADRYSSTDQGQLNIATTHTQARYWLPAIVAQFKREFPQVHLQLHQASPAEIVQRLLAGEAELGIATERVHEVSDLVSFEVYDWHHAVVLPRSHPLAKMKKLTLAALARYPLITYQDGYTGRAKIDAAFAQAGLQAEVVMSALDADVIKAYVELGLGVGIIAQMAYSQERDAGLTLLDASSLFAANTTRLAIRKGQYLRRYALRFAELCAAKTTPEEIQRQVLA
jgi:LysR family transcriptional regulator, cys regulon transcriptional activator